MYRKKHITIIFTGSNGFPFGSAVVQRQMQLANALKDAGFNVIVINRRGTHSKAIIKRENIKRRGDFKGIKYFFGSFVPYKPSDFLSRNFLKPVGFIGEYFYIFYTKFFKNAKYIFNNSISTNQLKYYYFLSKLLRLKIVYDYVEFISSIGKRELNNMTHLENTFDYKFYKYTDRIIVISSFLETHIKSLNSKIKLIKIPPIIDFSYYDNYNKGNNKNKFFLFCGSAAYIDIIKFVISSFKKISSKNNEFNLTLVISGDESELRTVTEYIIENKLKSRISVFSKIPYTDLITLYKSASALLIPFSKNLQDKARFPFKICEYTASKSPIITSDVPLINDFFSDGIDAYLAEVNSIEDFSEKMCRVIDNPKEVEIIGVNAYNLGLKRFDYKVYVKQLDNFLKN